jgi:hypothetical protein
MKTSISAALIVAAIVSGSVVAFCQDNSYFASTPGQPAWLGNNDFTNKVVMPTPEYYTNNQAAISADAQYRVQQEGTVIKPGAMMAHSSRIEPHPPTTVMENDPWIQQQHLWDISPDVEPSTSPGHKQ